MKKFKFIFTFVAIVSALGALAQEEPVKEIKLKEQLNPVYTGVTSLTFSPDTRGAGLGDIGAATTPDCFSQYWNPAKYAFTDSNTRYNIGAAGLFSLDNQDGNLNIVGYARLGESERFTVSASYNNYFLGKIPTEQKSDSISPSEFYVDLACTYRFSRSFSGAIALRYIKSGLQYYYNTDEPSGSAFAADLALYYHKVSESGRIFGLGLNLSNIGSKISYDGGATKQFIPANLRIGASLQLPFGDRREGYEEHSLMFSIDVNKRMTPTLPTYTDYMKQEYPNYGPEDLTFYKEYQGWLHDSGYTNMSSIAGIFKSFGDAPGGFADELKEIYGGIGMEYKYMNWLSIRGGYHYENGLQWNHSYASVGAGIRLGSIKVDAAYAFGTSDDCPFNNTVRLSATFDLANYNNPLGE